MAIPIRDQPPSSRPSYRERLAQTFGPKRPFWSVALGGLLVIGVLGGLYAMRSVFVPLTCAVMLYFLLRPLVGWLARWHVPRALGSALVLGAVLSAVTLALMELAGPAAAWAQRLPTALHQVEQKSHGLRHPLELVSHALQAVARMMEFGGVDRVPRVAVVRPGSLQGVLEGAAALTSQVALALVAAYFLLIDGDRLLARLFRLVPALPDRQRAPAVMNEVGARMSRYLLTVTLINVCTGASLTLALYCLGMPNPWLWGGIAAVLTYVPYLGPAVGIAMVALASFVTFPTAGAAIVPPLVYLAISTTEGSVVTPLILGRAFRMSPLVVFMWLALWVWLWSVPGAILAVPMLMLVKIICDESPALSGLAYLIRR